MKLNDLKCAKMGSSFSTNESKYVYINTNKPKQIEIKSNESI